MTHPHRVLRSPLPVLLCASFVCSLAGACAGSVACGPGTHQVGSVCVADVLSDAGDGTDASGADAGALDGGTSDGGGVPDAGPACVPIALPASDPGSVGCEDTTCMGGTVCVVDIFGPSGRCYAPSAVPSGATVVRECDEAADCGTGALCCYLFHYEGSWAGTTTSCESSCAGASTQMCTSSTECGGALVCEGWSVSGGRIDVATCQAPIGC